MLHETFEHMLHDVTYISATFIHIMLHCYVTHMVHCYAYATVLYICFMNNYCT